MCPVMIVYVPHERYQGYAVTPYLWTPHTVDIQLLRIGNFVMLIIPGELTTMAGRRLR
jgi:neutral ceramidase